MELHVSRGMGFKTSNGMELKMSRGMGIKTSNGMKLKSFKGMGLRADNNYIKFNEYERARKYLQMGSHIPRARAQKPQDLAEKVVSAPVIRRKLYTRKKWRKATVLLWAVSAFREAAERRKRRLLHFPVSVYNSRGTMMRTFSVFQPMLNV